MSAVGGATSKSTSGPSSSSSSSSKPEKSSSSSSSSSQSQQSKDSFDSGDSKKKKVKVDLSGGDTSSPARAEVSQSASTGPAYERKDEKELAPGTTAKNRFEAGSADASVTASGEVGKDGAKGNFNAKAEATAFEDEGSINNKTKLLDGEKPLTADSTVSGSTRAGAEVHVGGEGYASLEKGVGGSIEAGGSAAITGEVTGRTELNTVGENGEKENLASLEAGVRGHLGLEAGIKAGAGYKDGEVFTEFGLDLSPIAGGGFDVKVGVNVENIAEHAGDLGYQAQKGLGETLSGIQKYLEGIHLFG